LLGVAYRWDEEKVDCTFRPEINEHSKALLEERDRYYAEAEAAGNLEEVAMHKAMMRQRVRRLSFETNVLMGVWLGGLFGS
jgi:hypothetical protein